MKNTKFVHSKLMLSIVILLISLSITTSGVYGHHFSENMKWQLVYISHNSTCSNYDIQMTRTYSEIASNYLDEYQLENSQYGTLCINEFEYLNYVAPFDLDLIVLIYDNDIGRAELQSQNIGGFYYHIGKDNIQNHAIVICDCPTFNFSSPTWIMTHELSHFVLTYLGYDMNIIEDLVHSNDEAYDECFRSHSLECGSLVMKIRSETSAYSYSVMPLYQPAVGAKPSNSIEEELPIQVVELSKVFTKWWTDGKISDADFFNALGFMATGNSLFNHMNPELLTADSAYDAELSLDELLSDDSEIPELLSRIPQSMLSNDELFVEDLQTLEMPTWFKTTAEWWTDGKISDEEFQKTVNFLRNEGLLRPR
jgi:hypothetical protein